MHFVWFPCDMHFVWFPCEMAFSHHKSQSYTRVPCDEGGILRQVVRIPSRMENHTKCIFLHILPFKAR